MAFKGEERRGNLITLSGHMGNVGVQDQHSCSAKPVRRGAGNMAI